MFKIEFFCDDKRLAPALRALTGIALQAPSVTPVINAEAHRNGIRQATNGTITDLFTAHMDKTKPDTISVALVRDFLKSQGTSGASAQYVLKKLLKSKRIRKARGVTTGAAVKYDVLPVKE